RIPGKTGAQRAVKAIIAINTIKRGLTIFFIKTTIQDYRTIVTGWIFYKKRTPGVNNCYANSFFLFLSFLLVGMIL
ncbi:MAG: hypothetical protein QXU68_02875, partial [Candidatus Bathyarchaeia archaeon]